MDNGNAQQPRSAWARLLNFPLHLHTSKQSQCWRPRTLQPWFLGAVACLLLAILGTMEGLRQYSENNGGLVSFSSVEDVKPIQKFAYTYVPSIVVVILIQIWSVVDFDVLRLEPYYQLSKADGAPANNLFLNYNFGQKTLTPFRAAKHRHWTVFWVALVTFVIRMGLLPLQTMVFGLHYLPDLEYLELETWPSLIDIGQQGYYLEEQGNGMAAFTSDSRLPLSISPDFGVPWISFPWRQSGDTSPWKTNHTVFWAEHSCRDIALEESISPKVEIDDLSSGNRYVRWSSTGIQLDHDPFHMNGAVSNCTLDVQYESIISSDTNFFQTRVWETSYKDGVIFRGSAGCNQPDVYALLLSANMTDYSVAHPQNFASASIFTCNVAYYTGKANVYMFPHNNSLVVDHIYRDESHIMTESEFHIKSFQGIISKLSAYFSDTLHLHKDGSRKRTEPYSTDGNEPQMSPPLLQDAMALVSPEELEYKITRAINSTFLLSIEQLFDDWRDPSFITASRSSDTIALTVVPFAALWSELFLGAAAFTALYLIFLYHKRESLLRCDPNSIGSMCSIAADIIHPDNVLADRAIQFDRLSTRQLHKTFEDARCYWRVDGHTSRLDIIPIEGTDWQSTNRNPVRRDPRPHFLVFQLVLVELLAIFAILVLLGLGIKASHKHGRSLHGNGSHSSPLHIILHLVPAVIASSLNSLCTSMLRHVSLLEPWLFLEKGTSSSTLSMNYAPQSPFSTFYKAVRDRRFILVLVSFAASVTIFLMVLAAGVFHQSSLTSKSPTLDLFESFYQTKIQQAEISDESFHFDLVRTSISGGSLRLPWTTQNQTFIPIHIQDKSKPDVLYQTTTLGISNHLKCHHIPTNTSLFQNESTSGLYWHYRIPGQLSAQCNVPLPWGISENATELNESIYFLPPFDVGESNLCASSVFVMSEREDSEDDYPILPLYPELIGIHCEPEFTTQRFNITFNHKGDIHEAWPVKHSSIKDGALRDNVSRIISHFTKFTTGAYLGPASEVPFSEWEDMRYDEFDEWAGYIADEVYIELYPDWDPLTPHRLSRLAESLFQRAFNSYFSASHDIFLKPHSHPLPSVKDASVIRDIWSVVFSVPVLFIAMVLISFDISVIIFTFFARQNRFKGPRMPKSIGSTIPWIIHSRILQDFRNTHQLSTSARTTYLASLNKRYAFGRFRGPDGQERVALEEDNVSKDQGIGMS